MKDYPYKVEFVLDQESRYYHHLHKILTILRTRFSKRDFRYRTQWRGLGLKKSRKINSYQKDDMDSATCHAIIFFKNSNDAVVSKLLI